MAKGSRETRPITNDITEIKSYIHQNTDQLLDRAQLAEMAGFSVPHFHRIFTAETGENIAAYIRRVRLTRAAQKLMMGAVDISQVALAAGYQTHAAFSKAFKQRFGLTPSQYRKLDFPTALQTLHMEKPDDQDQID